jgi:hypothetical protein
MKQSLLVLAILLFIAVPLTAARAHEGVLPCPTQSNVPLGIIALFWAQPLVTESTREFSGLSLISKHVSALASCPQKARAA